MAPLDYLADVSFAARGGLSPVCTNVWRVTAPPERRAWAGRGGVGRWKFAHDAQRFMSTAP